MVRQYCGAKPGFINGAENFEGESSTSLLFHLRIVPQLSSGVVSLMSLSSICTTPQRGSSRRSRLGSTKGGKLFRAI